MESFYKRDFENFVNSLELIKEGLNEVLRSQGKRINSYRSGYLPLVHLLMNQILYEKKLDILQDNYKLISKNSRFKDPKTVKLYKEFINLIQKKLCLLIEIVK
jgi:hypothetical protein